MGDTTASIPLLLSLLLVLGGWQASHERASARLWLVAGSLAGASVGLKLTMGAPALALGALIALRVLRRHLRIGAAGAFLGGGVLGFLATAGHWCWLLWERFGNPLFPFVNQVFRSPYLPAEPLRDLRWAAQGPWDLVAVPLLMAIGETIRLQEIPFRDARFLLVLVAALGWISLRCSGRRSPLPPGQHDLWAFFLMAYLAWMAAFFYYRYASVLEYLAPLVLVILVQAWLPRVARPLVLVAGAYLLVFSSFGSWQRHAWWDRWWRVTLPTQAYESDSLVLLTSPLNSFLVPYFPERTRFVGLEWVGSPRFDDLVTATLGAHRGTLMALASVDERLVAGSLRRYALTVTDDCGIIRTGAGKKTLCRVVRSAGAQPRALPASRP
jgi:hypothetical protein